MSQLVLTAVGGDITETVQLADSNRLVPGPDELLIAIEAAPINNADYLLAAGWFAVQPAVPHPMGAEGVGRVRQAGADVDQSLVGRRVIILPTYEQGVWADEVVVAAGNVVPVSGTADPQQLAMLPVNPVTAHALLSRYVTLKPGDWVGQNLGNSAVGQYVIALAKRAGVKTVSVVRREEAAAQLRALGADLVVIDGDNLASRVAEALGGTKLRLVLDGAGGTGTSELVPSLETGGTVVSYSAATGQSPVVPLGDLIYRETTLHGFFIVNWIRNTPRKEIEETYAELGDLVEQGVLKAAVEATYPIDQYREALAHAQRPGRTGKILFTARKPTT